MTHSTSRDMKRPQLSPATVEDLARALKTARETNRQIVPIVGAGLSADCGFPVITAVVRYFGKLYRYIKERAPLRCADVPRIERLLDNIFAEYQKQPWRFVEDFGWPDRFQLNQDLYVLLKRESKSADNLVADAVRGALGELLPEVNPQGSWAYGELREDLNENLTVVRKVLGVVELEKDSRKNALNALNEAEARLSENRSKSTAFDVVGDWRRLILSFTNYRSDYADALFARFGSSRQPGQGHRFLAFLVKFLAVPTVFTFNFDSLIEQALESEGARPRVFAMERGAGLPHSGLVRDHLSVIKMHGSTHALLLDEQLDRPLSDEYLQRFAEITKKDPLLLVVGCSESDRRLRDLVAYVVNKSSARALSDGASDTDHPSVLWLHYERQSPHFLNELVDSKADPMRQKKILACPTNNPGASLQHLYSWLTSCHPAGHVPYLAHVQQPVHHGKTADEPDLPKNRFELISSLKRNKRTNPIPSASHMLLERANHWARNGYHFIWIDLEAVHTFDGVVGSIIDQCRKYDPDLPPSVLPVDIDRIGNEVDKKELLEATIHLAAKRVARALRRTRYYLALDGLETYVWAATTHHGLSHMAIERAGAVRLKSLVAFLGALPKLEDESLGESLVGISVDDPISRHTKDLGVYIDLNKSVKDLRGSSFRVTSVRKDAVEFDYKRYFKYLGANRPLVSLKTIPKDVLPDDPQRKERLALVLFTLSCFRRMRPLAAVRHLIKPLLGGYDDQGDDLVETTLKPFLDKWNGEVLQQLEGGGYWFTRTIRNKVYAQNTTYTDTDEIGMCLTGRMKKKRLRVSPEDRAKLCRKSAFQLCMVATTHQRIARTWYTRTFVQSGDTFSFLEYTYHRMSSVRCLAKLRRLVTVAHDEGNAIAKSVVMGLEDSDSLNQLVRPQGESTHPGFENDDFIFEFPKDASGSQGDDAVKVLGTIEGALKKHHRDELGSLYRAWRRAEVALRTQVPAEQLLHWCNELLTDDLVHRCNRVVTGYVKRRGTGSPPRFRLEYHKIKNEKGRLVEEFIDDGLQNGVIKEFRRYLQDLQVKLWIERSDYETCIGARWRHLLERADEANNSDEKMTDKMVKKHGISRGDPITLMEGKKLEQDQELIGSCDVTQCHQLLDIVNCRLQMQLESSFTDNEVIVRREAPLQLLKKVEARLKAIGEQDDLAETNNLNEAWLRLLHLQAENHLGRITVFSHDGFTDKDKWKPKAVELDDVRKTISSGLERIRTHDARTDQAPHSVVLDPTTDGALYLQYRSVFYVLKGRTDWLGNRDEGLQEAQRSFQLARGGLGNHSPLMSALIELYAVEAQLGQARQVLLEASSDSNAEKACNAARGLYDSARGGLQRARESLLASRRNVIWRKFFFRLTTQYHSDRLLLGYARLRPLVWSLRAQMKKRQVNDVDRQACGELLRHFLLRLRRAYQSLLTAVDLYLPPQSIDRPDTYPCPNRFRWLYRMWWELTLCGYATGRLALTLEPILNDADAEADADKYVRCQLNWLNETGGINDSQLGTWIKRKYRLVSREYMKINPNLERVGAKRALEERRKLIDRAMEMSKRSR